MLAPLLARSITPCTRASCNLWALHSSSDSQRTRKCLLLAAYSATVFCSHICRLFYAPRQSLGESPCSCTRRLAERDCPHSTSLTFGHTQSISTLRISTVYATKWCIVTVHCCPSGTPDNPSGVAHNLHLHQSGVAPTYTYTKVV